MIHPRTNTTMKHSHPMNVIKLASTLMVTALLSLAPACPILLTRTRRR